MKRESILLIVVAIGLIAAVSVSPASGLPSLSSLWPNEDGKRWQFQYTDVLEGHSDYTSLATLQLHGTVMTAGGLAQVLDGTGAMRQSLAGEPAGLSSLYLAIWRARPDLRRAIEERGGKSASSWAPSLLHYGYFMKGATQIQMWQPDWTHPTWTYLTSDLSVGATFTHQLVPELANDIYLHGTVSSIDDVVSTPAGNFTGAVKISYLIDYGVDLAIDEAGNDLARIHSETTGYVRYVPGIGPVEMHEVFTPVVWIECLIADCSSLMATMLDETQDLVLTSTPTPIETRSWGEVKSLYR